MDAYAAKPRDDKPQVWHTCTYELQVLAKPPDDKPQVWHTGTYELQVLAKPSLTRSILISLFSF